MVGKIDPRLGVEVFISESFDVCLKQYDHGAGDQVIALHPSEAEQLIELLKSAIRRSAELQQEELDNA